MTESSLVPIFFFQKHATYHLLSTYGTVHCDNYVILPTLSKLTIICHAENQNQFSDDPISLKHLSDNWPVRNEALKELDSLKTTHEIVPLNVIDNETQVLPSDIENVLSDALVEVTFYMEYYQNHASDKFNARTEGNMTQIIILHRDS